MKSIITYSMVMGALALSLATMASDANARTRIGPSEETKLARAEAQAASRGGDPVGVCHLSFVKYPNRHLNLNYTAAQCREVSNSFNGYEVSKARWSAK